MTLASSRHILFRFALPALAALAAGPAQAATWLVLPDGTGDLPTIQDALEAAADGDEVLLGDGTFSGPGNQDLRYLGKEVTVRSASGTPSACVLEVAAGSPAATFAAADGPASSLRDVTVTGTVANSVLVYGYGAFTVENVVFDGTYRSAVYAYNASPTIRGCTFRDGGAPVVECSRGTLALSDCLFESTLMANSAGALELDRIADGLIERCTFRDGVAVPGSYGYFIACNDANILTFRDCEVVDIPAYPLGIRPGHSHAEITVEGCRFSGNDSGISANTNTTVVPSSMTIRDCELLGDGSGTGVGLGGTFELLVENCVIDGFQTGLSGATYTTTADRTVTVRNTRIANSASRNVHVGFPRLVLDRCKILGAAGDGAVLYRGGAAPYSVDVRDCLIAGNGGDGLTLHQFDGGMVERTTIASNASLPGSAGLRLHGTSVATLRRSVVWGNCAPGGAEILVDPGSALAVECSDVDPAAATGVITYADLLTADPQFCDAAACASLPSDGGLYTVESTSPLLQQPCGPIGAFGDGCAIATSAAATLETSSWGMIKERYR